MNSFACLPATLSTLRTVFLFTPTVSAVPLMLPPLTSEVSICLSFSNGSLILKRGVPLFSEKVPPHVLQRSLATLFLPYLSLSLRFPLPVKPWSGQALFGHENEFHSSMSQTRATDNLRQENEGN